MLGPLSIAPNPKTETSEQAKSFSRYKVDKQPWRPLVGEEGHVFFIQNVAGGQDGRFGATNSPDIS